MVPALWPTFVLGPNIASFFLLRYYPPHATCIRVTLWCLCCLSYAAVHPSTSFGQGLGRTPNKNLSKRQFWISQSFRAGAEFTLGNPDHWVQVRHPQVLGNPPRRLTNKSRIGNTKQVLTPSCKQAFIAHD